MKRASKGEHEERVETAKNLLEDGAGFIEIQNNTKLSDDEIRKYNKEVKSKH